MSGVNRITVADADDGLRLDKWFKRHYPDLPFGRLARLLRTGQVRVDGKRAKAGQRLEAGVEIRVPPLGAAQSEVRRRGTPVRPEDVAAIRAMTLYEDDDVLVLDKPPGLASQGGTGTSRHVDGMLEALREGDERPLLVHRLDRDTSGVLVLAKTRRVAATLGKAFRSRRARKIYWALVVGVPEMVEGRIAAPLAKEAQSRGERMEVSGDGKRAVTLYRVMDRAARKAAWLALMPLTGRTHQLRVHCVHMGHPIVGDGKYGGKAAHLAGQVSGKLHLHARRIVLDHPRGGTIDVTAPLPAHMAESWRLFGFNADENVDPFPETL
ncbi:MAG: RluA family pseudouridine synthase [Alphaproteobacteria bacterium]|nr:MAG: RluA family pseudouridine synthase [Alphaproteobacteria bacterium]